MIQEIVGASGFGNVLSRVGNQCVPVFFLGLGGFKFEGELKL